MKNEIGVSTGLAWTPSGGELIHIEATLMKGKGSLILTGQLGNVMQESAKAALSYARTKAKDFKISESTFSKTDIHIHVPAGAIPKDGPSAGITMATALISALTKRQINNNIAMTGEITLRGRVLPIGGLKEKSLAAKRAGIESIIVPSENEKDLYEIPDTIKKGINYIFVDSMDKVLKYVFVGKSKANKKKRTKTK